MGIGQMRDRVKLKQPTRIPVPGGGGKTIYTIAINDWTQVKPLSSSRVLQDSQIELKDGFQFEIRWRKSPQPNKTMLVEFEGKDYTINSIQEINQRKRYWVIMAIGEGDMAIQPTT